MVTATCIVDVPSGALFLIPADPRLAKVIEASIQFHCATVLSDHNRSVAGLAPPSLPGSGDVQRRTLAARNLIEEV